MQWCNVSLHQFVSHPTKCSSHQRIRNCNENYAVFVCAFGVFVLWLLQIIIIFSTLFYFPQFDFFVFVIIGVNETIHSITKRDRQRERERVNVFRTESFKFQGDCCDSIRPKVIVLFPLYSCVDLRNWYCLKNTNATRYIDAVTQGTHRFTIFSI